MTGEGDVNDKRIRIMLLIDELQVGGTERQVISLAESLPRERFEPVIGVLRQTGFGRSLAIRTPIVDFAWSGLPLVKNLSLIRRIRDYLTRERIDILQTQFVESEIYGTLAARLCRPKPLLVATRRNLYHWIKEDPVRFRVGRRLLGGAQAVLANSYCARDACLKLESPDPGRVRVIPNGIELAFFDPAGRKAAREACGVEGEEPLVGVVGNLRRVKGADLFLEAFAQVVTAVPRVRAVLIGGGAREQELRELSASLGIADRVLFLGSRHDAAALIAGFDVAVQPSRSESFSNVLAEYMAAGRAVVATRVGDAGIITEEGSCARLVPPEDPAAMAREILFLLRNPEEASAMGTRARARVAGNWSRERIIGEYAEFYGELVAAARENPPRFERGRQDGRV